MTATATDPLLEDLARAVGPAHVLTDPDMKAGHEIDWTGRWKGWARAVVRPATTQEVVAVVRLCGRHRAGIVPQGGNTGLVGGAVPRHGEVVVSLTRLGNLGIVDETCAQVTAGAGVSLARLQAHAAAAGFAFAVDLSARDSATVGGMVATNAGGVHVVRYGSMRSQLIGVEAVLADGSVLRRMGGLIKDNTGYDLASLLCGSEGTLAVITAARLRLVPHLAHRVTALIGLDHLEDALSVTAKVRTLPALEAVEVMFDDGIEAVREHAGLGPPFPRRYQCVLLIECAAQDDPTPQLASVLADLPGIGDTAVAVDAAGRSGLWAWRERHAEAVNALGVPHKLDVTLPLGHLAEFEHQVRAVIARRYPNAQTVVWGHLGDGNLHVNVVGPASDDDGVDEAVLGLVAEYGGSVSAEHGIGMAKRQWVERTRGAADVAAMRAIKRALDPTGLLNPEVLFAPDVPGRDPRPGH